IDGSSGAENVLNGMEGMTGVEDAALIGELRAAALEPSESLTVEHVYASVQKLFDAHLSRTEHAILEELEELKKRGNEGAPVDLLKRLQEIQSERSRVANTLKARA